MITAIFLNDTPLHPDRLSAETFEALERKMEAEHWHDHTVKEWREGQDVACGAGVLPLDGTSEEFLRAASARGLFHLVVEPGSVAPPVTVDGYLLDGIEDPLDEGLADGCEYFEDVLAGETVNTPDEALDALAGVGEYIAKAWMALFDAVQECRLSKERSPHLAARRPPACALIGL